MDANSKFTNAIVLNKTTQSRIKNDDYICNKYDVLPTCVSPSTTIFGLYYILRASLYELFFFV